MVNWNNLDTVASYAELEKVDRVKLVEVLAGEAGADRVRKYSAPMMEGMAFNYASRPVDDKVLEVLAKLAKEAQLTEKYAELLDVGVNDSIYIKIDEFTVTPKEVKVVGIAENYIFNYVYMTPALYHSIYNVEPDINILMIKSNGLFSDQNLKLALTRIGGVNSITTNTDEVEGINEVIKNLYFIIILMCILWLTS